MPDPLSQSVEPPRSVGGWNRLRLILGYGCFSRKFRFADVSAKLGIFFSVPLLAIWVWKISTSADADQMLAPEGSGGLGVVALPAGLLGLALLLAVPAYLREIAPRIEVLLTGDPCHGRVESIAVSQFGNRKSRAFRPKRQIRWSSVDETRSGASFPISKRAASRFEEGQEIIVYCDRHNHQQGEIDVLGLFSS